MTDFFIESTFYTNPTSFDVTSPGFGTVDAAMFLSSLAGFSSGAFGDSHCGISFGARVNGGTNSAIGAGITGGRSATTDASSRMTNRYGPYVRSGSSGAANTRYDPSHITDGLRLTKVSDGGGTEGFAVLGIKNADDVYIGLENVAGTSVVTESGPGFEPDLVIILSARRQSNSADSRGSSATWSVGITTNDGEGGIATKRAAGFNSQDAQTLTNCGTIMQVDASALRVFSGGSWATLNITEFTSTGFKYQCNSSWEGNDISFIAIKLNDGEACKLVDFTIPTSGDAVVTGAGFTPKFGLTCISGNTSPSSNPGMDLNFGIGFFDGVSAVLASVADEDGVSTSNCGSGADSNGLSLCHFQSTGGVGAGSYFLEAEPPTMDSDGFTIPITSSPVAAVLGFALLIGDQSAGGSTVDAAAHSIAVSPQTATVLQSSEVLAALHQIDTATHAASVSVSAAIQAALHTAEVSPGGATVSLAAEVNAAVQSITLTPNAATVELATEVSADLSQIAVQAFASNVQAGSVIAASVRAIVLASNPAQVVTGATIGTALHTIGLEALQSGVTLNVTIQGSLHSIGVEALAAGVGMGFQVEAFARSIELTPHGATLELGTYINAGTALSALDTFTASITSAQAALLAPGIEYTLPDGRAHFTLPEDQAHFTLPISRIHFTFTDED